jgi:hypothetical protein
MGAPLKLKREVEPPQRPNSGIGVLVVASAAMFFAVAGSAFILRARMAHMRAHEPIHVVESPDIAPMAQPDVTCGEPTVHDNGDGTASVTYRPCAQTVRVITEDGTAVATPLPDDLKLRAPR